MAEVLCIGDSCADVIIPYGLAIKGEDVFASFECGGSTANTACALGKLGVSVSFIGRAGKDLYGLKMKEELERNGIDTSKMIIDENGVSTQILVIIDKNGERLPFLMPKDNPSYLKIYPEDLKIDADTKYIVTNGMMLFDNPSASSVCDFIESSRNKGIKIILDINYRIETRNKDPKYLNKVISMADVLLGSIEDDYLPYTHTDDIKKAISHLKRDDLIIVARNTCGSYVFNQDYEFYTPSYKVELTDTLGAGDAANAGFIYGLVNNLPLSESNAYGCLMGAYCVNGKGARHTPDIKELNNFKSKYE
ncbi:MAG: carbohydrate kinase family protein [Erysipelotrichaceae bacterium]|nr:carbohydrate kinase family protein [Erysipelotrichaceae bacterium]